MFKKFLLKIFFLTIVSFLISIDGEAFIGFRAMSLMGHKKLAVSVPGAPGSVVANTGANQITTSWGAVSGATSYNLYWKTTTGVTVGNGTKITGVTNPYIHTSLSALTTYYYIVTAVNAAGESTASVEFSATTQATSTYSTSGTFAFIVPPGVSSISVTSKGAGGEAGSDGDGSFGSGGSAGDRVIGNITVTPGESLDVVVAAAPFGNPNGQAGQLGDGGNGEGNGGAGGGRTTIARTGTVLLAAKGGNGGQGGEGYYNSGGVGGAGAGPNVVPAGGASTVSGGNGSDTSGSVVISWVPAPAAPTGVSATAGTNQVSTSWSAVAGATSYNIYWKTTTGVTIANGTKITNVTSPYVHSALSSGTTYYYIVTAMNGTSESPASAQVSATAQAPATTQTFSTPGSHSFTVPAGVTSITVNARGAGGAGGKYDNANNQTNGANGNLVNATVAVTPGSLLTVHVGGKGLLCDGTTSGGAGGYGYHYGGNGSDGEWGGYCDNSGVDDYAYGGGGGGGSSAVLQSTTLLIEASGGAGGRSGDWYGDCYFSAAGLGGAAGGVNHPVLTTSGGGGSGGAFDAEGSDGSVTISW